MSAPFAGSERHIFAVTQQQLQELLPSVFLRARFPEPYNIQPGVARGASEYPSRSRLGLRHRHTLEINWEGHPEQRNWTVVRFAVYDESSRPRILEPRKTEEVREILRQEVDKLLGSPEPLTPLDPVLAPGERLEGPFRGHLRDYSGCATRRQVRDLVAEGVPSFPLGRYTFRVRGRKRIGKMLALGQDRSAAPLLHKGVLVCAPQNSGKTSLIVRWARSANRAGFNLFLVDVKGNLYDKLMKDPAYPPLKGQVYYFSTDPGVVDCHRLNFLSGFRQFTAEETEQIRQLVAALLPSDGWLDRTDDPGFHYRNQAVWLTALIRILKLREHYDPSHFDNGARGADLSDLYDLVSDEQALNECIKRVAQAERRRRKASSSRPPAVASPEDSVPQPGIDDWFREIALLLDADIFEGGQRTDARYSFRDYTQALVQALQPFSRDGTLYPKIRDGAPEGRFQFEDLLRKGTPEEPVTFLLGAREQDLAKAETVLALTVKRLQQLLFERMKGSRKDVDRPILLLLDETRRIRGFRANEYVTFAREARAGCVLVYQSLDQIGDEKKIAEMLENVGTQIYLGSLVGNTARTFVQLLPKRYRTTFTEQLSYLSTGVTKTYVRGTELVDYFGTGDLYRLPAGKWPALVYINDHPRRNPVLVDMNEKLFAYLRKPSPRQQPTENGQSRGALATERSSGREKGDFAAPEPEQGDQLSSSGLQTLAARIADAPAGATIRVAAGVYNEHLTLSKPVYLTGDGSAGIIILENSAGSCVEVRTKGARLSGLTLVCRADVASSPCAAVVVLQGNLELQDCSIHSDAGPAVSVRGKMSSSVLRKCRLGPGPGVGVEFHEGARGEVVDCEIQGHAAAGLLATQGSNVTIAGGTISRNGGAGVVVEGQSFVEIKRTSITRNRRAAIEVAAGCSAAVHDCDLTGNADGPYSPGTRGRLDESGNRE